MRRAWWSGSAVLVAATIVAACGGGSQAGDGAEVAAATADDRAQIEAAVRHLPRARDTIDTVIDASERSGRVDADTALSWRAFALFGDPRLPADLRSAAAADDDLDEVDGNAVVGALLSRRERLSPEMRAALDAFRTRPGAAGSWIGAENLRGSTRRMALAATDVHAAAAARPTCTTSAAWANVVGTVAPVRVWYDQTRSADLTQAQAVVAALDTKIWPKLIATLGFDAPLSDLAQACNGGDAKLDLYVVATLGSRGVTIPESASLRQSSTFILLRSGLTGVALNYTVTHQFMHAVMWSYLMAADQPSYGWMRNAMANWAVEAVYPGNATLLADATCLMNSNFLSITNQAAGSCSSSTSRTRDYGAYLLYQYIGRTLGKAKVRELLAATTTLTDALAAIEAHVNGGLGALWPKFAKTLWNQTPITDAGRPAFLNWDGNTSIPVLAPDHPTAVNADRGSAAEASTGLSDIVENVSTRYYRFTFSDTTTRTLMFHNTFQPLYKAGKKVSVQALWRVGGVWTEENWSAKEWIGFCRDLKAQRLDELVVIVASGEVGIVTQVDASSVPTFKRNNIGCWGYGGTAKRTTVDPNWSSGKIVLNSTPLFDLQLNPGGTGTQYNDAIRLRVPIAAPLFRQVGWSLSEAYTDSPCSYALNASAIGTSIMLGGLDFGSIVINNFAESLPPAVRQEQYTLIGKVRGAYTANLGSQLLGLPGTVTGPSPDCGPPFTYDSAPALYMLTNATAGSGPVIRSDGHLAGTFTTDGSTFNWDLAPLREP